MFVILQKNGFVNTKASSHIKIGSAFTRKILQADRYPYCCLYLKCEKHNGRNIRIEFK